MTHNHNSILLFVVLAKHWGGYRVKYQLALTGQGRVKFVSKKALPLFSSLIELPTSVRYNSVPQPEGEKIIEKLLNPIKHKFRALYNLMEQNTLMQEFFLQIPHRTAQTASRVRVFT